MDQNIVEALEVFSTSFYRILKVNLSTDRYTVIKSDDSISPEGSVSKILRDFSDRGLIHIGDVDIYRSKTELSFLTGYFTSTSNPFHLRYRRKVNDGFRWAMMEMIPDKNFSKDNLEVMLFVRDMHDAYIQEMEDRRNLEKTCNYDTLTSVYNYNAYKNLCLRYSSGSEKQSIGVIFADLNGLKMINDTQGHEAGNDYIICFAKILQKIFRKSSIYRISGDEFLVIFQGITEKVFISREKALLDKINEDKVPIASIGWNYQETAENIEDVTKFAEDLMYISKHDFYRRFPEYKRNAIEESYQREVSAIMTKLTVKHEAFGQIDLMHDTYHFVKDLPEIQITERSWSKYIRAYAEEWVEKDCRESFISTADTESLKESLLNKETLSFDYEMTDGRWMTVIFTRIDMQDGSPSKVIFNADITAKRKAERLLKQKISRKEENVKVEETLISVQKKAEAL